MIEVSIFRERSAVGGGLSLRQPLHLNSTPNERQWPHPFHVPFVGPKIYNNFIYLYRLSLFINLRIIVVV